MIVRILGDSQNGFDGKFTAQFEKDGKIVDELFFDLEDLDETAPHALVSGNAVVYFTPEPMQLRFDEDYEMDVEYARKVFNILAHNGWNYK